jgi:hypothetical protein
MEIAQQITSPYLVQVDNRLPFVIALKVELSHTDFTEVSRVIFVDISAVVMLATSHTATTGVLAVLPYTAVPGRDMAATEIISRDQLGT